MTDNETQTKQQSMEGAIIKQPETPGTTTQRQPPMEGAIIKRPAMQGAVIQRQPQMQGAIVQRQPGRQQPMQGAIIKQRKWMEHPGPIEGIPPGMEPLVGLDHILVKQLLEYNEMTTGSEGRNEYDILNKLGEQIYKIKERSEELQRIMYGNCREFIFPVRDKTGQEHDSRHAGSGFNVAIMDADRQHLYMLTGDTCACQGSCCPNDLEYPITDGDGNQVANIYKRYAGTFQEALSDADTFGLTLPKDMIINHKILLFGTIFLVDFIRHEKSGGGGGR